MSQPLQSINLVAPAFKGINTEDSPIAQDPSFAEVADNCVIDKRGRIASRRGVSVLTTNKTELSTDRVHKVHEFIDDAGNTVIFTCGNNKIMTGTTTLTDATPAAYTITANNWNIVNFNDKCYFFQVGHEPLVYDNATGLRTFSTANGSAFLSQYWGNVACAAYGRLWIGNNGTDQSLLYWTDLLDGTDVTGGSSGSIDLDKVWPDGYDRITAVSAHNNLLIIFGEHSIVIYGGADFPATMALQDTVAGVGCVDRNSVQHIGTDILFLSYEGLRSFGRTIQEKSNPLNDLSKNIKRDLLDLLNIATEPVESVYSPENSFYLLTFPDYDTTYCFDVRGTLENGAYRVTRWPTTYVKGHYRKQDGTLLLCGTYGVGEYSGYVDDNTSYQFKYYSPSLSFGDPSKLKMIKKIRMSLVGANDGIVFLKWGYDFNTNYTSQTVQIGSQIPAFYGADEYPVYSELSGYSIASTALTTTLDGATVTYYSVDNYLGEASTAPVVGSGGGAVLNGDSYYNTTDDVYYVYVSGAWADIDSLTISASDEYTGGELSTRPIVNGSGSGSLITIGLESEINGFALSLQEINVLALMGKTL